MRLALFQMDEDIYQPSGPIIISSWMAGAVPGYQGVPFLLPSVQQRSRFTTGTNLFLQKLHSLAEKQDPNWRYFGGKR